MIEKKYPKQVLKGLRVELRKHNLEIAQQMFEVVDANRRKFSVFLPWVKPTRVVADTRQYLEEVNSKWANHELFDFGMFRVSDNTYMGNIGVHHIDWKNEVCEIGYWIGSEFQKNGFVREAVSLLEKEMFLLGFHRIEIRCSETNSASIRIPEALGFEREGTLRENAIENGIRRSTVIFSKLSVP